MASCISNPLSFFRLGRIGGALAALAIAGAGPAAAQTAPNLSIELKPEVSADVRDAVAKLKQACGTEGPLTYGAVQRFDIEATRRVRMAPTLCPAVEASRFTITPALPAKSGLALNPETGVISGPLAGDVRAHRPFKLAGLLKGRARLADGKAKADLRKLMRQARYTVTLRGRNRVTGEDVTVTAPFDYKVTDSNPIQVRQGYARLVWHPHMGTREHLRPEVQGGAAPYAFRVSANARLPRGFRFDRTTGAISGAPAAGPNFDGQSNAIVEVRDARGRVKLLTANIGAANPVAAIGPTDLCFIFVHGHRDDPGISDPAKHARAYWGQTAEKDHILKVPDPVTGTEVRQNLGKRAVPDRGDATANRLPATRLDKSMDLIDIVTNNRTQGGTSRASGNAIVAGNVRHRWAVVSYNSHQPYWQAANEVAAQLDDISHGREDVLGNRCDPATVHGYVVVAHSMGGLTTSYVNGNSRPGAPNFEPVYARAMERIDVVVTIQSPLNGSFGADVVCGDVEHEWRIHDDVLRHLPGFTCDDGVRSMRTRSELRLENRIAEGPLPVPTLMAAGHVGMTILPSTLDIRSNGEIFPSHQFSRDVLENDGFVETLSQWACAREMYGDFNNNPDKGRHYYGPCRGDRTIRRGFQPFVMSTETHDRGRNGFTRGAIINPCAYLRFDRPLPSTVRWSTGSCEGASIAEQTPPSATGGAAIELNIAEAVRCYLGFGKTDANVRYACPTNGRDLLDGATKLVAHRN